MTMSLFCLRVRRARTSSSVRLRKFFFRMLDMNRSDALDSCRQIMLKTAGWQIGSSNSAFCSMSVLKFRKLDRRFSMQNSHPRHRRRSSASVKVYDDMFMTQVTSRSRIYQNTHLFLNWCICTGTCWQKRFFEQIHQFLKISYNTNCGSIIYKNMCQIRHS